MTSKRNRPRRLLGFEVLESKLTLSGEGLTFADPAWNGDDSAISGVVYHDRNNDGALDWDEVGLNDVVVTLVGTDLSGQHVSRTQTTGIDGSFTFRDLDPGQYSLQQIQPAGYLDGKDSASTGTVSNDSVDSIDLAAGEHLTDFFFGELAGASIRGTTFVDVDRDGANDAGDDAIDGIGVLLTGIDDGGQSVTRNTLTDANGDYEFENLRPGVYSLTTDQPGRFAGGRLTVGTFDGSPHPDSESGSRAGSGFNGIQLNSGDKASNYDFGEWDDSRTEGILATDFDTVVNFKGTSGDDVFIFKAGATTHTVILNGERFKISASENVSFRFDGRDGADRVELYGTENRDEVNLRSDSGKMVGTHFEVRVYRVSEMIAHGRGGNDRAYFYDSEGDDTFTTTSTRATMASDVHLVEARNFHRVYAYSTSGVDTAVLQGSSSRDQFKATPTDARMYGESFYVSVRDFDSVTASGNKNHGDQAEIWDSAGDDQFTLAPNSGHVSGQGFNVQASGFRTIAAIASAGGDDTAILNDSSRADTFTARPTEASLTGTNYANSAYRFEHIVASSNGKAGDVANLFGSFDADRVELRALDAALTSTHFDYAVHGFKNVNAYAAQGHEDRVEFFDTETNDVFMADEAFAQMTGKPGFTNTSTGFSQIVANSTGGNDVATLFDSSGDDLLRTTVGEARLEGLLFDQSIAGFRTIDATASEGEDRAEIYRRSNQDNVSNGDGSITVSKGKESSTANGFDDEEVVDP